MRSIFSFSTTFMAIVFVLSATMVGAEGAKIEDGRTVTFDYTLKIDGEVVESSEGKDPLKYEHGAGVIIPGLESRLVGLMVGDEKSVVIPAKEGYGEINEEAYREIPRASLPEGFTPESGMIIEIQAPDGGAIPAIVWEVKEESVVLNFNHPLAGKTLQFDVKIVSVK